MLRRAIAEASHPWVLLIEPAERVSSDLAKEIQFLLAGNPSSDGFRVERRNYVFGHVIRFGGSTGAVPVRLFRRDGNVLPENDQLDGQNRTDRIGTLRGKIEVHFWTVEHLLAALTKSAALAARKLQARGRRVTLPRVLFHAPLSFLKSYFVKLGFLDGWAGLHWSILSALFVYVRYAKLWQMRHGLPHPHSQVAQTPEADEVLPPSIFHEPADPLVPTDTDDSIGPVDIRLDGSNGMKMRRAA